MKETLDSPGAAMLLLHIHCDEGPIHECPFHTEVLSRFESLFVIEKADHTKCGYRTTYRGRAWIEAICEVEKPRIALIDGQGKVLVVTECPNT